MKGGKRFPTHSAPERVRNLRHGIEKPELKTSAVPGDSSILDRLTKIESQNRRLRLVLLAVILLVAYLGFMQLFADSVIVKQTLLESEGGQTYR